MVPVFDLREYVITARGQHWPCDEGLISATTDGEPVAVIRTEPWPEVWERPWPDGVLRRPWLWRLLGAGGNPDPRRTAVRRLDDGYPLVLLHHRVPVFFRTVGVFDAEDSRVAYCRWSFKGAGSQGAFSVVRIDHSQVCEVRPAGDTGYRVVGADGNAWAVVSLTGGKQAAVCRVSLAEGFMGTGQDGVLLLAAGIVLFQSVCDVGQPK